MDTLTRYENLMKALREMGLPKITFCEWLKAVKDFETPLKRN